MKPAIPECILWAILLLLAGWCMIFPFLPPEWFIARDPVTGAGFRVFRSHTTTTELDLAWGFAGLRQVPGWLRLAVLALVGGMLWKSTIRSAANRSAVAAPLPAWMLAAIGLAAATLCYVFRVSYDRNATFGDGPNLAGEMAEGLVFPAEILTCRLFGVAARLAAAAGSAEPGRLGIALSSCLCGGAFAAALAAYVCSLSKRRDARMLLFLGVAGTAIAAQFLGYIETTVLGLAAGMVFFACGERARATDGRAGLAWCAAASAAMAVVLLSHAAGVLLGAALLPLLVRRDATLRQGLRCVDWRRAGVAATIILPAYLLVAALPYYLRGEVGNISGGGDHIRFVPWTLDYASRPSGFVYYSMLSWWHGAEILSALMACAPLAIPLALGWGRLRRLPLAAWALPALVIPVAWNHDFSVWGDWNISATYLFSLHLTGWTVFAGAMEEEGGRLRPLAISALAVQIVLAAGLVLQFY